MRISLAGTLQYNEIIHVYQLDSDRNEDNGNIKEERKRKRCKEIYANRLFATEVPCDLT